MRTPTFRTRARRTAPTGSGTRSIRTGATETRGEWASAGARGARAVARRSGAGRGAGGCYNYEPVSRAPLVPAAYVAVTLSDPGTEELGRYLGPDAFVVRGRLLGADSAGLRIAVAEVETRNGRLAEWRGEPVDVPGQFVRRVELRHGAPLKTGLLAGASLAGLVLAYRAFGPAARADAGGGGGGGTSAH